MKRINIPHYADTLYEKLLSYLSGEATSDLDKKQIYGVMLASTLATHNSSFINEIVKITRDFLDATTVDSARSAVALTGIKMEHKGLPCLESEIFIENVEFKYLRDSNNPHVHVSEIEHNKSDDIDFKLYLLAASFIADFDYYANLRVQYLEGGLVTKNAISTIIHIATIIQSIAEIFERTATRKKKILVVDDEVRMTRIIKLTLEKTDKFEVRTENKGSNAIATAHDFKPDLILLDVVMPDMGGEEIAVKLKENHELSHIKVIFLTGLLTNNETNHSSKEIGGSVFLAKPVRNDDLIHCIENQI